MDPLEGLGDHGTDTQQEGTLGCPVSRASHSVVLATQNDERRLRRAVVQRGVVHGLDLTVEEVRRVAALGAGSELVANPDVGKRPSRHDAIVATP